MMAIHPTHIRQSYFKAGNKKILSDLKPIPKEVIGAGILEHGL